MADLKDVVNSPEYEMVASAHAKAASFFFIGVFIYLVGFTGIKPGFIYGTLFFVVGLFVSNILVAAPLMLASIKLPKASLVFALAKYPIIFFGAKYAYHYLFGM